MDDTDKLLAGANKLCDAFADTQPITVKSPSRVYPILEQSTRGGAVR